MKHIYTVGGHAAQGKACLYAGVSSIFLRQVMVQARLMALAPVWNEKPSLKRREAAMTSAERCAIRRIPGIPCDARSARADFSGIADICRQTVTCRHTAVK